MIPTITLSALRPAKCNALDFLQSLCAVGGLDPGRTRNQTEGKRR